MVTVVVTGGSVKKEFVEKQIAGLQEVAEEIFYVAVDKGVETFEQLSIIPNVVIGDFDSLDPEVYQRARAWECQWRVLNPQKDATDTEAAMDYILEQTKGRVYVYGATGTRFDHMMGNIAVLGKALLHQREVYLMDETNRIRMIDSSCTIKKEEQFGHYVSVIPYGGLAKGVTLQGFFYPLENAIMSCYSSLGVSNEIVADEAQISVSEGRLLVVESS